MAKIINISDKLSNEKPQLQLGDKTYDVNDGMSVVIKFEELATSQSSKKVLEAMEVALGKKACEEIGIKNMSAANLKVVMIAIMAAVQGLDYEDADARFRKTAEGKQ